MSIYQNPFYILGATPRDSRQKIVELAQEKSLELDSETVTNARLALTTPRKRIAAEISWFPGISNKKALEIIKMLKDNSFDYSFMASLPSLVSFNVIAAFLPNISMSSVKDFINLLYALAVNFEDIDIEKLIKILNEDRSVAGISEITDLSSIDSELQERKNLAVKQVQYILGKTLRKQMTAIMLGLINRAVENNKKLELVDTFIDKIYMMEVQNDLQEHKDFINKLAKNIEATLAEKTHSKTTLSAQTDAFIQALSEFDSVMQPIQVSMQQRGLEHDASRDITYLARSVAIDLANLGNEMDLSEKLMRKVRELFIEIDSVDERISKDLEDLQKLKNEDDEWKKSISCRIEEKTFWGSNVVEISPKGIIYRDNTTKLEDIVNIRYGLTIRYVNGSYSGTDTMALWGSTKNNTTLITWLKSSGITGSMAGSGNWEKFVNCLWKAVGPRLLISMANELALGSNIYGIIYNDKVKLVKSNYWTPAEEKYFKWNDVTIFTISGHFGIKARDDSGYSVMLSYQDVDNVHIVEMLLRLFFNSGRTTISQSIGITKEDAEKQKRIDFSAKIDLSSYAFILHWIVTLAIVIFVIAILEN